MSKLGLYESVKAVIICQSSECISKQKLNSPKICEKLGGPILGVKAVSVSQSSVHLSKL